MNQLFNPEGKLFHYANKLSDLIILNLWVVVTSIPIITIGASTTAMHCVLLNIYRNTTQSSITRCYFISFKDNFIQSTIAWFFYLIIGLAISFDLYILNEGVLNLPSQIRYFIYIVAALIYLSANWFFILQSRYKNNIRRTGRNALLFCFFHFWDTLMIGTISLIPFVLVFLHKNALPVVLMGGFTMVGIICTSFYSRIFKMHERERKTFE